MTALLINDLAAGGAQQFLVRLIAALNRLPNRKTLLLILLRDEIQQTVPEGVEVMILTPPGKSRDIFTMARSLKRLVQERNIVRVQSYLYRSNFVNILSRFLGSRHEVYVCNTGRAGRLLGEGLRGRMTLLAQRILYPRAHLVMCLSQGMAEDLRNLVPKIPRLEVLPLAFDIIQLSNQAARAQPRGPGVGTPLRLVSLSRLVALKRHDLSIRVLRLMLDLGYEITLAIHGEGEERPLLEELILKLNLQNHVTLSGYTEDPMAVLASADVLFSLSGTEGFPNILVEAMIARIPVLSTDCPSGPREILAPDTPWSKCLRRGYEITPFGVLVPVDDRDATAQALSWIIANPDECRKMADRARERAETWDMGVMIPLHSRILFGKDGS